MPKQKFQMKNRDFLQCLKDRRFKNREVFLCKLCSIPCIICSECKSGSCGGGCLCEDFHKDESLFIKLLRKNRNKSLEIFKKEINDNEVRKRSERKKRHRTA